MFNLSFQEKLSEYNLLHVTVTTPAISFWESFNMHPKQDGKFSLSQKTFTHFSPMKNSEFVALEAKTWCKDRISTSGPKLEGIGEKSCSFFNDDGDVMADWCHHSEKHDDFNTTVFYCILIDGKQKYHDLCFLVHL